MGSSKVTIKIKSKKAKEASKISHSLAPAQKQEVKKLIAGNERVQYVANAQLTLQAVTNQIISKTNIGTPTSDYLNVAIPLTTTGLGISNRVGTKIQMIKGSTDFFFSFKKATSSSQSITVFLFLLNSKECKSAYNNLSDNLIRNNLLMKGDNTTCDWLPSANSTLQLAEMKLNTNAFKGRVHKFILQKNSGAINNDSSTPPPAPNATHYASQHHFTWHWGHKKNLKYEPLSVDTGIYPTNFLPLWGCVAYYADGTPVGEDGTVLPIEMSVRNHMWFHNV